MRRLLALLLVALPALGQQIDSSQMKLKTNGGVTGDSANAVTAIAADGVNWAPDTTCTGTNSWNAICSANGDGVMWTNGSVTHFDLPCSTGDSSTGYTSGPWIEIDSFRVQVR